MIIFKGLLKARFCKPHRSIDKPVYRGQRRGEGEGVSVLDVARENSLMCCRACPEYVTDTTAARERGQRSCFQRDSGCASTDQALQSV